MTSKQLIELAGKARENAYAPYSGFAVGAAVLCADGSIFCGCNVENASYTPTCCAERVAIFKAVSEGHREFVSIAIVGGKTVENVVDRCFPCGVCRQVMSEFCSPKTKVIYSDETETTLEELLPNCFSL